MQKDGIGEKKRKWAKIEEVKSLRTKLQRANRWFGHFMTIGEFEYSIEYIEKPKERKRVKIDLKMPPRILGTNCIFVKRHGQRSWHTYNNLVLYSQNLNQLYDMAAVHYTAPQHRPVLAWTTLFLVWTQILSWV